MNDGLHPYRSVDASEPRCPFCATPLYGPRRRALNLVAPLDLRAPQECRQCSGVWTKTDPLSLMPLSPGEATSCSVVLPASHGVFAAFVLIISLFCWCAAGAFWACRHGEGASRWFAFLVSLPLAIGFGVVTGSLGLHAALQTQWPTRVRVDVSRGECVVVKWGRGLLGGLRRRTFRIPVRDIVGIELRTRAIADDLFATSLHLAHTSGFSLDLDGSGDLHEAQVHAHRIAEGIRRT